MRVLVVYGTTEGQTRKIAEHVARHMRESHNEVGIHDVTRGQRNLETADFDAAVIVASIHQ